MEKTPENKCAFTAAKPPRTSKRQQLGVPQGYNSGPPSVCEETSISLGKLSRHGY